MKLINENLILLDMNLQSKDDIISCIADTLDVYKRQVRVDGQDIRTLTLESLRKAIGIVQQDVYLFTGSVKENIAYGKPGCTDEEIIEAAKKANIHDFIMGLPDGYDTYVGERGTRLSGGQKQRISIARVFLKDPRISVSYTHLRGVMIRQLSIGQESSWTVCLPSAFWIRCV